jgi:hypothetical protein
MNTPNDENVCAECGAAVVFLDGRTATHGRLLCVYCYVAEKKSNEEF